MEKGPNLSGYVSNRRKRPEKRKYEIYRFHLLAVIIAIILLLLIAVIRTLLMPGKTSSYVAEEPEEESLALAQKLAKMIQYDTTSHANVAEVEKFLGFHKVLEELFPLVHEKLEKTEIDGNLLFYWKGKALRSRSCS